jgi:SAM-dependent methyltransferase
MSEHAPARAPSTHARQVAATNATFYGDLWAGARLHKPHRFNTWPLVTDLAARAPRRLEIGPGMRPRLPIPGTCFLDIDDTAIAALGAMGGIASKGELTALPYPEGRFDLVAALDIIEHVEDDTGALAEIDRVLARDGTLLLSVPLHPSRWTRFDAAVGHYRRYRPEELLALLASRGFVVERSAVFGMQPRNEALAMYGLRQLQRRRAIAMRIYNWILMPLATLTQKPLGVREGLIETDGVDEVILVCRRRSA